MGVFSRVVRFLSKIHQSHTCLSSPILYTCYDSNLSWLPYVITSNGVYFPRPSITVSTLAVIVHLLVPPLSERNHLCNNFKKKKRTIWWSRSVLVLLMYYVWPITKTESFVQCRFTENKPTLVCEGSCCKGHLSLTSYLWQLC